MGLLMMSATIGGLGLAFILLIISAWTKQVWLSKFVLGAVAIWFAVYAVILFGVSLTSEEKVFDLPANVKNPRLDIKEGYGIDHAIEAVLIGDEDSVWHKRNYFALAEQKQNVSVN